MVNSSLSSSVRPTLVDCHEGINHLAVSADGRWLATSDVRMSVEVKLDGLTQFQRSFRSLNDKVRPTERVRGLAFSQDGNKTFIAAGESVSAHDSHTGETVWSYVPPRSFGFLIISPIALAVGPHGDLVVSFDNGSLGIWSPEGVIRSIWRDNDAPRWLSFTPGGDYIVGTDSFSLCTWSTTSRRKANRIRLPDRVYGAAFSKIAPLAAVRTLCSVLVYNVVDGQLVGQAPVRSGLPLVEFHPSRDLLLLGDKHSVHVTDFQGQEPREFKTGGQRVVSIAFDATGENVLVGCDDHTMHRFAI